MENRGSAFEKMANVIAFDQLTSQQQDAIGAVNDWYSNSVNDNQYFFLSGYAGTGKTTIVPHILNALGIDHQNIQMACLTAQAARVLGTKTKSMGVDCETGTIHNLIYIPYTVKRYLKNADGSPQIGPDGEQEYEKELYFKKRVDNMTSEHEAKFNSIELIIVDEGSMVPPQMYNDLLELGKPVLILGDTGQLPPVENKNNKKKIEPLVNLQQPDFELTEIKRQTDGNTIVFVADEVRRGKRLSHKDPYDPSSNVFVAPNKQFDTYAKKLEYMAYVNKIICATNSTRIRVNKEVRAHLGITDPLPQPGEPLVCLQNDKKLRIGTHTLSNGMPVTFERIVPHADNNSPHVRRVEVSAIDERGVKHTSTMLMSLKSLNHVLSDAEKQNIPTEHGGKDEHTALFDFAYAITCHKAQGSQWENIIVIYEPLKDIPYEKWVYSAITRASNLVLFIAD